MSSSCFEDWQNERDVLGCNKYMLDHQLDCDICFQLDCPQTGKVVMMPAHKYVLTSRSPVFFAMLSGPMAEKNGAIKITDVTPEGFLNLLRFLYHEEIDLTFDTVFTVLYAAKKYIVTKLVKHCVQFLETIVRPENACLILDHNVLLEDSLEEKCIGIIQKHTKKVLVSETFYRVSNCTLCKILKCGGLSLSELEVYKACDKWAELQCTSQELAPLPENKRQVLGKALYLIHIPSMSVSDFTQVVVPSRLLSMQEENIMFKHFTGDKSVRASLPFPSFAREFFAFTCKVHYDGYVRHSTIVTPLYDGFIRRSKWSITFHVDSAIKIHEIGFLGLFHGTTTVTQNGSNILEVQSGTPEKCIKLETELSVQMGHFTVTTDASTSYDGDYYYKTMRSSQPDTECDSDGICIIANECTTVSLLSHFTFTHSEDMFFVDDYFND